MTRDASSLRVCEMAHHLAIDVYQLTRSLPAWERYGLTAQLRRAVVSIPTNIVEGCSRRSTKEYERFIEISVGSALEVRYLLRLIVDLGLLPPNRAAHCRECSDQVCRTLQNVLRTVEGWEKSEAQEEAPRGLDLRSES